ncbi:MAG TPA: regulatory protein RecX [Rhodospirillaceae bacterium]|nr:regulatory protein RecX [Rhodospirillaceae bacterium]
MSKPPKPITAQRLENIALAYLERFSASAVSLRRVLMRRVARAEGEMEAGAGLVDALVERFLRSGLLDDRRYADGRVASLHRRGASLATIRQYLKARGVDAELVEEALGTLAADLDNGSTDLAAARHYARRRRLGPFRPPSLRAANRQRDLAALGRAGYSWDVARAVIDGEGD